MTMKVFMLHRQDMKDLKLEERFHESPRELYDSLNKNVNYFVNMGDDIHIGLVNFDPLFNKNNINNNPVLFIKIIDRKMFYFSKTNQTIIAETLAENHIKQESVDEMFDMYSLISEIIKDIPKGADGYSIIVFENPIKIEMNENGLREIINIKSPDAIRFIERK